MDTLEEQTRQLDPDGPINALIQSECVRIPRGQTVGQALQGLRSAPPRARLVYFYVVDEAGHLVGVASSRGLILSPPERPVDEIQVGDVAVIPLTATIREARQAFGKHRYLALPVVDSERMLRGTIDLTSLSGLDTAVDETTRREDLFQATGVREDDGHDSAPHVGFRGRFPWLGCNMLGGVVCAFVGSAFEKQLQGAVALALFIPVVLNLAESVSSQSVSLTLHVLHHRQPSVRWMLETCRAELATGLMLGVACGGVIGLVSLIWLGRTAIALSLLGGIGVGVTVSAILGVTLPVALRLLRLDPRVAAGPIALAGADVITILAYLGSARWLLG